MWTTKLIVYLLKCKVFGEKWVTIWITSLSQCVFVWSVSLCTTVYSLTFSSSVCCQVSVETAIELTISDHTDSRSALLLNAQALRPGNPACWKMFELQIQMKHKPASVRVYELLMNCCGPKAWSSGHPRALFLPHEQFNMTPNKLTNTCRTTAVHSTFNILYL